VEQKVILGVIVVMVTACLIMLGPTIVSAQQSISSSLGVVPYPSKGQSKDQQNKAFGACMEGRGYVVK
jgi:hypothetical protein